LSSTLSEAILGIWNSGRVVIRRFLLLVGNG
jgi:hypothetical protein